MYLASKSKQKSQVDQSETIDYRPATVKPLAAMISVSELASGYWYNKLQVLEVKSSSSMPFCFYVFKAHISFPTRQ